MVPAPAGSLDLTWQLQIEKYEKISARAQALKPSYVPGFSPEKIEPRWAQSELPCALAKWSELFDGQKAQTTGV